MQNATEPCGVIPGLATCLTRDEQVMLGIFSEFLGVDRDLAPSGLDCVLADLEGEEDDEERWPFFDQ